MQHQQISKLVTEINKYDQDFNIIDLLQKRLDKLKYIDSIKDTFDGKLALFLIKRHNDIYIELLHL